MGCEVLGEEWPFNLQDIWTCDLCGFLSSCINDTFIQKLRPNIGALYVKEAVLDDNEIRDVHFPNPLRLLLLSFTNATLIHSYKLMGLGLGAFWGEKKRADSTVLHFYCPYQTAPLFTRASPVSRSHQRPPVGVSLKADDNQWPLPDRRDTLWMDSLLGTHYESRDQHPTLRIGRGNCITLTKVIYVWRTNLG